MPSFEAQGMFYLGKISNPPSSKEKDQYLLYSSKNLVTHAVCLGMTGSGKTGLGITLLEEAALDSIPSIVIDPKGDMGNMLLTFPDLSPEAFKPWVDNAEAEKEGKSLNSYAKEVAKKWREGLETWGESPKRIQDLKDAASIEIYTPASQMGIPLSILNSFEAPSKEFALDPDAMRERVLSTTSSILGLLGIKADPIKSREHILISTIIGQSWQEGRGLDLADLIQQIQDPSFDKIGVLDIDTFFPPKDRVSLSIHLNNLLASPGFQAWMKGVPLNIQELLYTPENKPKISIISIAHLNDAERMFFVTLFLNQLLGWVRKQSGTSSLKAILYMDEIFGYFPPVASPPSKMPMITLLKQARAYGLGMVLCTQNPVDLDYKGLSNCGTWFIGRLQTARDKLRVTEGLAAASNGDINSKAIDKLMSELKPRMFIMRSIYEKEPIVFQTRWTLSYLRGPLTLAQIKTLTKNNKKTFELSSEKAKNSRTNIAPVIPTGVPQYFIHPSQSSLQIHLHPFIAGFAKLHFIDKKYNIDEWVDTCIVIEPEKERSLDWSFAVSEPDLRRQLTHTAIENATYDEVPSAILHEKKFLALKNDLASHLYQNGTLKIFEAKELKLVSKAQESEADFNKRIAEASKEYYDEQVQKLRERYEKNISALKDKIRKAEIKKSRQQRQSLSQKFETFISFITTIIGTLFGKKLTKKTIDQAGTTFRRMGRIGKENQEVTHTEEALQTLEQRLQEMQSQLEIEITKIPFNVNLNEVIIKPRKADIIVTEVALIWRPDTQ